MPRKDNTPSIPKTSGNAGGTICTRISQQRKKSKQDKEVTKHKKHTL